MADALLIHACQHSIWRSMHKHRRTHITAIIAAILLAVMVWGPNASADENAKFFVHRNWQLQSSCEAKASGDQISAVGFDASKWHRTNLPNTAVGALVDDKT